MRWQSARADFLEEYATDFRAITVGTRNPRIDSLQVEAELTEALAVHYRMLF
jgi:hypothetical protein